MNEYSVKEEAGQHSLTVIMPAFNEAENIRSAYEAAIRALTIAGITDYEFFIITATDRDGSNDGTPDIVAGIMEENPRARHFHTPCFTGLGYKYRAGVYAATKDYVMMIPANNLTEESSLVNLMLHIGQGDAIFTYTNNPEVRPSDVRLVSRIYVTLCNILFGLDMKYYNGISIVRRDLLLKVPLSTDDHSYMTEVVVYLARSGVPYLELPQFLKVSERAGRAWNMENSLKVLGSLGSLFWRINIDEERLKISGVKSLPVANVGALLLDPNGTPDFMAIFKLARQNFVQTIHPILVCLVKSLAKSLGLLEMGKVRAGVDRTLNLDKITGIAQAVASVGANMLMKLAMTSISDVVNKRTNRKKSRKRKKGGSLSIVMPAYNEAERLPGTCEMVDRMVGKAGIGDYEIIIVTNVAPDGSYDGTLDIADNLAVSKQYIRHIRNESYAGMGYRFRQGVGAVTKDFVMMIPGDGEFDEDSIAGVMANLGKSEIIVPYISNPRVRPPERQLMSQAFVSICNKLFGLSLKYYNGMCIIPTEYLRAVPMSCDNYAFMAEILIYLLKSGVSYKEVPFKIKPSVNSKAFRAESVNEALESLVSIFYKVNVEGNRIDIA